MELKNTKKKYKVEIMEGVQGQELFPLDDEPTYYIDDLNRIQKDIIDDFLSCLEYHWLGHEFVAVVTETEDEEEIAHYYFSYGEPGQYAEELPDCPIITKKGKIIKLN